MLKLNIILTMHGDACLKFQSREAEAGHGFEANLDAASNKQIDRQIKRQMGGIILSLSLRKTETPIHQL